jgi:hypothetical protein
VETLFWESAGAQHLTHISGNGSQFLKPETRNQKPETRNQKLHSTFYCTTSTICCVRVADPDVAVTLRL